MKSLKLTNKIGNRAAADQLGIKLDTLYTSVSKAKNGKTGFCKALGNVTITDADRLKQVEMVNPFLRPLAPSSHHNIDDM